MRSPAAEAGVDGRGPAAAAKALLAATMGWLDEARTETMETNEKSYLPLTAGAPTATFSAGRVAKKTAEPRPATAIPPMT